VSGIERQSQPSHDANDESLLHRNGLEFLVLELRRRNPPLREESAISHNVDSSITDEECRTFQ
jgi:hypothetical protein